MSSSVVGREMSRTERSLPSTFFFEYGPTVGIVVRRVVSPALPACPDEKGRMNGR